jgi:hypothetical protein
MNKEAIDRLLSAARALFEAHQDQIITRVEWEAIAEAVAAATDSRREIRQEGEGVEVHEGREGEVRAEGGGLSEPSELLG